MVNYETDYLYGLRSETEIKAVLEKHFGRLNTSDRYCPYDFYNDTYIIELKTRKCAYDTYPTTMITSNKLCMAPNKKLILCFKFTDGIYYIEYNESLFSNFERKMFSRAKLKWDEKPHAYIPIQYLTPICEVHQACAVESY